LRDVKTHFHQKVEKVVAAKDYQIKCQRMIAVDAAKRIVSSNTRESADMFNTEVTKLVMQYSRILDLVDYFESVVKEQSSVIAFQEKMITKLQFKANAKKID